MQHTPEYIKDTIAAAATPPGTGGIAVVRISGPDSGDIARCMTGLLPEPRRATLATFRNPQGEEIDRGMVLYFPAPQSFTGESVVELHGHGGPVLVGAIVDAALAFGARAAEPGEFSRRAFLNDKLDLVQAEAIADLIGSGTKQAARAALRSLSGTFSSAVDGLQQRLTNLRLHVEAALDFPEEEIDFLTDDALAEKIDESATAFEQLLREAKVGRALRDGLQIVIVGRPNAGKSSLLNLLSGQDAAIVTEVAGTTRDILRERIDLEGLAVELVDTAGLRDDPDRIEAEGIRRARDAMRCADAILWIQDATVHEPQAIADVDPDIPTDIPLITVRNKIDLTGDPPGAVAAAPAVLNMSAISGDGADELRTEIRRLAGYRDLGEGAYTARRRHVRAIEQAGTHFENGRQALQANRAGELFAEELRLSQQSLGEITGSFTNDDLLGRIFSEFCIGK